MALQFASDLLLWCAVLNYTVLLAWFTAFRLGHAWMRKLHGRWFQISDEYFDGIHYACMAVYKVGILLFNVVPYVALHILGSHIG